MGDNERSQKLSLPFGDVIRRVAFAIYNQLQNVLHNMRIQSPELRTQSLTAFISRSKKKLAQLLAITRWLDTPGVSQFFANMTQLQLRISARENRLNENQDALYFSHSQLFSNRIRSLDVVSAKDILARGTYGHLPTSMFSSGSNSGSTFDSITLPSATLEKSLNIYLRSKLTLSDTVPLGTEYSSVDNGVFTMGVRNMFELAITLQYLDIDSPWNILRLKLCVSSHSREYFHSQQDLSEVENDVLMVLRRIAEKNTKLDDSGSIAVTGNGVDSTAQNGSDSTNLEDQNCTIIDKAQSDTASSVPVTSKSTTGTASPCPVLPRIYVICQHAAYATALRYLFVQASEYSKTIWLGICRAEFQEKSNYSQFVFRFWKSNKAAYYQYELRVIQLRSPHQVYTPLDLEIVLVDSDGKEIGGDVGLKADIRDQIREPRGVDSTITTSSCRAPSLIVELWTCSAPDDSEGSLKLTRRRVKDGPFSVQERTPKSDIHQIGTENSAIRGTFNQSESDFGLFDISDFITKGVSFGGLLQRVLELCAENRLGVLYGRLLKSPGILSALSSSEVDFTLSLEATQLNAAVGSARLTVFVDALSGRFSVGSSLLGGVAKGASKDCSLFLNEINNVESEQVAGMVHTTSSNNQQIRDPLLNDNTNSNNNSSSSASSSSSSSSADRMDVVSEDGSNSTQDINLANYLHPLSTASDMLQYLTAAYWSEFMKRVLAVENDELHSVSLHKAALEFCDLDLGPRNGSDFTSQIPKMSVYEDGKFQSRVLPLIFDACSWTMDLRIQTVSSETLSEASHDVIDRTMNDTSGQDEQSGKLNGQHSRSDSTSLADLLSDLTKDANSQRISHVEISLETNSIEARTLHAHAPSSRLTLTLCLAIEEDLSTKVYALLCSTSTSGTLFLPPKVIKAKMLLSKLEISPSVNGCASHDTAVEEMMENALNSAVQWARDSFNPAPILSGFGFYIPSPAIDCSDTKQAISPGLMSTIVLWSDAVSLLTVQYGDSTSDTNMPVDGLKNDSNIIRVSLLCPVPLPGVGTLGASGPPRCTVGVPRIVTSEEADRMKRRCISIGELSLTIVRNVSEPTSNTGLDHESPSKRPRHSSSPSSSSSSSSYCYQCGELSFLESFTAMSGLVQNELYSALARELLQHSFNQYPFRAPAPVVMASLSVCGDADTLSSLCDAYCSSRPLLEFILLASNNPAPIGDLKKLGSGTSKGILKILTLDCSTRSEPFLVCALYEIVETDADEEDSGSEPEMNFNLRLVDYIEVETHRSYVSVTDAPDTPRSRRGSAASEIDILASGSVDEPPTRKVEKVALKVSSLTATFVDQMVEMDVFRECFQKKLQAMSGRNPFHAFINKLVSRNGIQR